MPRCARIGHQGVLVRIDPPIDIKRGSLAAIFRQRQAKTDGVANEFLNPAGAADDTVRLSRQTFR
jgi:hypothetical protein